MNIHVIKPMHQIISFQSSLFISSLPSPIIPRKHQLFSDISKIYKKGILAWNGSLDCNLLKFLKIWERSIYWLFGTGQLKPLQVINEPLYRSADSKKGTCENLIKIQLEIIITFGRSIVLVAQKKWVIHEFEARFPGKVGFNYTSK